MPPARYLAGAPRGQQSDAMKLIAGFTLAHIWEQSFLTFDVVPPERERQSSHYLHLGWLLSSCRRAQQEHEDRAAIFRPTALQDVAAMLPSPTCGGPRPHELSRHLVWDVPRAGHRGEGRRDFQGSQSCQAIAFLGLKVSAISTASRAINQKPSNTWQDPNFRPELQELRKTCQRMHRPSTIANLCLPCILTPTQGPAPRTWRREAPNLERLCLPGLRLRGSGRAYANSSSRCPYCTHAPAPQAHRFRDRARVFVALSQAHSSFLP